MSEEVMEMIYGTSREDEQAIHEILGSQIPCNFIGPLEDEQTPQLKNGSVTLYGLEGIRQFLKWWNRSNGIH